MTYPGQRPEPPPLFPHFLLIKVMKYIYVYFFHVNSYNDNNNTLFTNATSRSDKNSLKHVREAKNVKKKRNNLKLPFLNLSKNLLL